MRQLSLSVYLFSLVAAAQVEADPLTLTDGSMTLNPAVASLTASGQGFSVFAVGADFEATLFPQCDPCDPGSLVQLSAAWINAIDVVYDIGPSSGFDLQSVLFVAAGSVVMPGLAPMVFRAIVPFTVSIVADAGQRPRSGGGFVAAGTGTALASFVSSTEGWRLSNVVYTLSGSGTARPPHGHWNK